jgi:hypothetical protein
VAAVTRVGGPVPQPGAEGTSLIDVAET